MPRTWPAPPPKSYSAPMRRLMVSIGVLLVLSLTALVTNPETDSPRLVIGSTTTTQATALPAPTIVSTTAPIQLPTAPVVPGVGGGSGAVGGSLLPTDGSAYGAATTFTSSQPVPADLQFILVIGSDARPGQDIRRTNGDSIHLVAVNPRTLEGTIVGIPRDSWVDIPGHGTGKINSSLAIGGPSLMVDTVRRLTGLPIQYYVLTGFQGLSSIVDALGGVNVLVNQRMNDSFSGARFEQGWHHFDGAQALAFSRNRHDTPNGDFSRSSNHGVLMQAALGKIRAEVSDDAGLRKWVDVLLGRVALDIPPDRLLQLAALGRRIDPTRLKNVVAPGRVGTAGKASVVYLTPEASGLFTDLRPDAVIGGESSAPPQNTAPSAAPAPSSTSSTTPPLTLLPTPTTVPGGPGPTSPSTLLPPIKLFSGR